MIGVLCPAFDSDNTWCYLGCVCRLRGSGGAELGGLKDNIATVLLLPEFAVEWAAGDGARGSVVVKALCYKPEGRGFDSR
jgi:hypothetical protein